jgi:hypothetical protein
VQWHRQQYFRHLGDSLFHLARKQVSEITATGEPATILQGVDGVADRGCVFERSDGFGYRGRLDLAPATDLVAAERSTADPALAGMTVQS